MIEVPDAPPRRTDRKTCRHCEASAAGCRSNAWLRGRNCCDQCEGNHDGQGDGSPPSSAAAISGIGGHLSTRPPPPHGEPND